ncbi:hypothetical protein GHT06_009667 [Daphnia sinensis]|uniref:Secreted protein n=1 Tax=Daphnia sinensis TaxID=1820382 RepID=A0AAD5LN83_9CRUS|nr:hypothetical protein GHT06_009667 [Daphnia sinensis]
MCKSFEASAVTKMSLKREIMMPLCVLLLIPLMCEACTAVSTDTAGIYSPVLPHRRMPQHSTSWTYPYYFDYPYPTVGQQTSRRLSKAVPAAASQQLNTYYYPYRYPYPYHYLYQNPSPVSPDFHAVNQVEFLEPISWPDFSGNDYVRRPWKKTGRLHPHPTVTILGPGGAGGGEGGGSGGSD